LFHGAVLALGLLEVPKQAGMMAGTQTLDA
jgi:hypothetical protein